MGRLLAVRAHRGAGDTKQQSQSQRGPKPRKSWISTRYGGGNLNIATVKRLRRWLRKATRMAPLEGSR